MTSVSVIVPAYNEERFLVRSLGSLHHSRIRLAETSPGTACQFVVVDNGSSDASAKVAAGFGARVVTESRRGVAVARNAGARAADGELLAFVDADYRVPMTFLPAMVRMFAANPTLCAAGSRVALEPTEIDPVRRWCAARSLSLLRRVMSMSFGVFWFRRGYWEELGGFDERLYAYEDVELLRRLTRERPVRYGIADDVTVYASARGFYRGRMLRTYGRMAASPRARRDVARCGYWYAR
ncbi:glycosyltransferase family A protein [Micromonosporaceae bacterium B7E4]